MFFLCHSLMLTFAVISSPLYSVTSTTTDFHEKYQNKTLSGDKANGHHFSLECPRKKNTSLSVHACKTPSIQNNILEFKNCDTFLSLLIGNISVQVCIKQSRIILPNASIVFMSRKTRTYPFHHKEISSNIKTFFTGSVLILQWLFPFSGSIHKSKMTGRSILFDKLLKLECNNFKAHEIDKNNCYQCRVFCPDPETDQDMFNLQKEKAFQLSPGGESTLHGYHQGLHGKHNHWNLKSKSKRTKMICSLHLVSDHIFFKFVGDKNFVKTINIMIELVNKVNAIFKKNFNPQKGMTEVGFAIRQITVYSNERRRDYKLNGAYMTSDEYLKQFSLYDFSSVCLGVGFTFRNFGNVMGTAFPAFTSFNTPGGICEERVKINSHYVSYNTVIMSFYSPNKPAEETLALTLTHELGHSFGARHDEDETDECLPGERIGNFIMSSMVNWGDKPNNYLFSKCSMLSIMPVIRKKKKCLSYAITTPICGNAIPEYGEECDCGNSNHCDVTDPCCTPADDKSHKPCTIRRYKGKLCSPKVSSCCNASCAFRLRKNRKMCNP